MDEQRPFRYSADPLLKLQTWEAQRLAADAARSRQLVDQLQARLDETLVRIDVVMEALRELYTAPQGISLQRRALLQTYLDDQHALASLQRQEVSQAQARQEQIMAQLQARRTQIKIMEQHRERKHSAHTQDDRRRHFKAVDDAWLLRRGGGRG